jgi:hypothetical protein
VKPLSYTCCDRNALWALSNGIPPDVAPPRDESHNKPIARSFSILFSTLDSLPRENDSGAECSYLHRVAARCAVAGGDAYIEFLSSIVSKSRDALDVLEAMARFPSTNPYHPNPAFKHDCFLENLYKLLLQHFPSNPDVRSTLRGLAGILKHCSADVITLPLLSVISSRKHFLNADDEEFLLSMLANSLILYLQGSGDLQFLFAGISQALSESEIADNHGLKQQLCSKVGSIWRKSLLTEVHVSEICFGRAISLIGQELLRNPGELMPISLLKVVAGQGTQGNFTSTQCASVPIAPLSEAVTVLLQVTNDAMILTRGRSYEPKDDDLLNRLAPLLLLRCLPACFFRQTIHDALVPSPHLLHLVSSVGRQLALRMGIFEGGGTVYERFTREEKCLSAEIASMLLPLGDLAALDKQQPPVSIYELLFKEAFKNLGLYMATASSDFIDGNALTERIKSGMAAICVTSQALKNSAKLERGHTLLDTAAILIQVISAEIDPIPSEAVESFHNLEDQIVELLASCKLKLISFQGGTSSGDLDCCAPNSGIPSCTIEQAVSEVWNAMCCFMKNGSCMPTWIPANITVTPPAKLAMWRSFLLVCQRCEEAELMHVAKSNLSWIVALLSAERSACVATHELILAAIMQCIFVIVTRTKTLETFGTCAKSRQRTASALLQFISDALRQTSQSAAQSGQPLRFASLTLFLSLFLVDPEAADLDSVVKSNSSLIQTTLEAIRHLSTIDSDERIQVISCRILNVFRSSVQ